MIYNFLQRSGAYLSSRVHKKSHYWFACSTDENSETLESSEINIGRSMLAMFLTVLFMEECLETEMLK